MSFGLHLLVPETAAREETLHQYYRTVREKRKELRPDREWPAVEDTSGYIVGKRMLADEGELFILETIPRRIVYLLELDEFYDLFRGESELHPRPISGQQISRLIALLEETKTDLADRFEGETFDPELIIETQLVTLCEFALDNGYRVALFE